MAERVCQLTVAFWPADGPEEGDELPAERHQFYGADEDGATTAMHAHAEVDRRFADVVAESLSEHGPAHGMLATFGYKMVKRDKIQKG